MKNSRRTLARVDSPVCIERADKNNDEPLTSKDNARLLELDFTRHTRGTV